MNFRGSLNCLTEDELTHIEDAAKEILHKTGFNLQHDKMLEILAEHGYTVDRQKQAVYVSPEQMEEFLHTSEKVDWNVPPPLSVQAGLYTWQWLDPACGMVVPSTYEDTVNLTRLADFLPYIDTSPGLGTPCDVMKTTVPLWQYFIAWRHSEKTDIRGGGIFNMQCVPYMEEMANIVIAERGGNLADYLEIGIEFISPLVFGRYEAEVFYETAKRGMNPVLMSMPSMGGSAPVTLAGTLALTLAEIWMCCILHRIFAGKNRLRYLASPAPLDMRSGMWRFGRAETAMMYVALGQLAKRRKALYIANCFVCEAHRPSVEAGYQKALTLIPSVLAGSAGTGSCGMLSLDEYNSPIQMILDNEFAGAIKRMIKGFDINEETLAETQISEAGFGGNHLGSEFTAERFRNEMFMHNIWTPYSDGGFLANGSKLDVDYAAEIYADVMANYHPRGISEFTENQLLGVIKKAEKEFRELGFV